MPDETQEQSTEQLESQAEGAAPETAAAEPVPVQDQDEPEQPAEA